MRPIPPAQFVEYFEPNQVKIIWTLEAELLGEAHCRFATETRAVATDGGLKPNSGGICIALASAWR
jgi:hypothetical protein